MATPDIRRGFGDGLHSDEQFYSHSLTHSITHTLIPIPSRLGLLYRHCTISTSRHLANPSDLISHNTTHNHRIDSSHLISSHTAVAAAGIISPHATSCHVVSSNATLQHLASPPNNPRSSQLPSIVITVPDYLQSLPITLTHPQSPSLTPTQTPITLLASCIYLLIPLSHIL